MTNIYEKYVQGKQWQTDSFGKPDDGSYYDHEMKRVFDAPRTNLRIVEFGFGNGAFLGWARSRGHYVVGVEQIDELDRRARAAGFETAPSIDALLNSGAKSYDLVVAFDVLEHLSKDELVTFLEGTISLLRSGGALLARFPNGDSPFGLRHQNGDITHCLSIGEYSVAQLIDRIGFSSFKLYPPYEVTNSPPAFCKWIIKLALRFCIEESFRIAYYGKSGPPTLSVNYILVAKK